jgi:hypothetical protein
MCFELHVFRPNFFSEGVRTGSLVMSHVNGTDLLNCWLSFIARTRKANLGAQ